MNDLGIILTSVLSSGVVATVISASLTESKERRAFKRSKIEETYMATASWLKSADAHFLTMLSVCAGRLTYNQMLDAEIGDKDPNMGEILSAHADERTNVRASARSASTGSSARATKT